MGIMLFVLVIIIAAGAAGILFSVWTKPNLSAANRRQEEVITEEEYLPLEMDGLYCCIRNMEDGLMRNSVFRFFDNAGKDDNGAVLSVVIGQRKPEDSCFPKEKWFNWENNKTIDGGRWKRDGNNIRITIELKKGKIIYKGTIKENALVLNSWSEITGHKEEGLIFELFPFEEVPGWWD